MDAYKFLSSPAIIYGIGAIEKASESIIDLGEKALIVCSQSAVKHAYVSIILDILHKTGKEAVVFDQVLTEPDDKHVRAGLAIYQQSQCDFIIAIGGGSPLDAAKAIGLLSTNGGDITEYMGIGNVKKPIPPLVAIPTTAGTGSEVTRYTVINDSKKQVKMLIASPYLIPDVAVVDPILTLSVPVSVTAATGMDALTHAIEGYTSAKNQPFTDNLALSAIGRISRCLPKAYKDGSDQEARGEVMLAAMEAGMVINNSSVTLVHGMSRPLGAIFHIPHGISNAVLLSVCMEFASKEIPARFARIAEAMGADITGHSDVEAARKAIIKIKEISKVLQIPTISELRIDKNEFARQLDKMAEDALASGSPGNTVRKVSNEDIISLYKKAL